MADNDETINNKKAWDFLKEFKKNDIVNVVAIDPHAEIVTGITRPVSDEAVLNFISKNNGNRNLYFMVNTPSDNAPDNKLKKTDVDKINAVWIDADPRKGHDLASEQKRLKAFAISLSKSDNPPTHIINSGGGIQAFWCLDNPVKITDETREHYEGISRALAQKYDTDSVHNIDRIMRVPHTWNIPTKKKLAQGRTKKLAKASKTGTAYKEIKFIQPVAAAEADNDLKYDALTLEQIKQKPSKELQQKLKDLMASNKKVDDLWNGIDQKDGDRSARDMTLAKELKMSGFTLEEAAIILWRFEHGKVQEAKYPNREIIRAYERSGNDFAQPISDADIERIANQVNPILAARKAGTPLEEDLDRTQRFRSTPLHEMNWRTTGRPIYRNFLYETALTVIYGKSNTGKSFFATDLAGHIALGRDYNGMEFEAETPPSVLYICAEAGQSFGVRGRGLLKRLGVDQLPFHVITDAPNFTDEKLNDAKAIVEEIKRLEKEHKIKIGMVVVDTLAVTFKGNENSAEDMGHYVANMKYIQKMARTGVLVVHHSGKDQVAGARGSYALTAAIDTEMEVKSEKRGEKEKRMVEVRKQREGKNGLKIPFGLYVVELGKDDRGHTIDTCHVVLENDTEFENIFPDETEGLNESAKAALQALKFYGAIPNPDMQRLTSRHIKAIIMHDIVKGNGIFDMKKPEKAMVELKGMEKPNSAKTKALLRACETLAGHDLVEKDDIYQLVIEEEDKGDSDGTE